MDFYLREIFKIVLQLSRILIVLYVSYQISNNVFEENATFNEYMFYMWERWHNLLTNMEEGNIN